MRKVKLFFLLTALLAVAQGMWAASKTFTSFSQGQNTQNPVTVYCNSVYSSRAYLYSGVEFIQISVSEGYTITQVQFTVYNVLNQSPITVTNGTLSNNRPDKGDIVTVSGVNNTQTVLQTNSGSYYINQIQVTYTANTYTVSFDKQSGSGGSNSVTATYGSAMPSMTKPARTGYTFGGYYTGTNGSGTQYYNANGGSAKNWDQTSNKTLYAKWTINPASVTTAPTAKTGLTYNGSAKALVNAGVASNGTMYYRIGTSGSWSTSIPTATNAGSYTVQYYAKGTGGASDSGIGSVQQITIAKANPTVTAPTAKSGLKYTGSAQALVNAGSTTGGTMQYKVGSGSWGTSIPTGTDVGTYTVYYKVEGNDNYNGNNGSNFQVTIAQSDQQKADAVIAQINAIGSPITAASQSAITSARTAYNALTAEQKALVTNYTTLTNAEAALAVVNLINAIGSPITAASQTAIDAARNAYANLTDDQKALVGNLSALTDAEAALAVVNQIAAIGEVTLSSGSTIANVRTAYNALTGDQQALVGNYSALTDAEDAYASLNVAITAKLDPVNDGVYYSTFYDGSRQLQLPANVEAYTATVSGDKMLLKKVAVPGDILPAATAVVLRASQADFTLIPSAASPVTIENNALRGTDVNMGVPSDHCYVLSGADGFVGFYPLSAPYTLTAHKAFIDLDNLPGGTNNAPRRLRFVFSEEQTATGMENVQNEETKAQKVMIDGVMYIIRGEHMYDAQGQIVK